MAPHLHQQPQHPRRPPAVARTPPPRKSMSSALQSRVDRALDLIAFAVTLAHRLSIILILLLAFLLSLPAVSLYPPALLAILLATVLTIRYVNGKKHAIADLIEVADEEVAFAPQAQTGGPGDTSRRPNSHAARALPKRIVLSVLDHVFGSASDTAMLAPLACVAVATVAFVAGFDKFGFVAVLAAVFCSLVVLCACNIARFISHAWVDRLFGDVVDPTAQKNESSPLLPTTQP